MDNIWPKIEGSGAIGEYLWGTDRYDESDVEEDDSFQLHYKNGGREEGQTDPTRT
jgi:hypothetical protein